MGKVTKVRKHSRRVSGANPLLEGVAPSDAAAVAAPTSTEGLSRGQRKRLEKRQAFLKRKDLVKTANALRETEKDGSVAAASMLSLSEALAEVNATHGTASAGGGAGLMGVGTMSKTGKVSAKARQRIAAKETKQLSAVHAHAAFKADPFAAIQEHLRNMAAADGRSVEKDNVKARGPKRK